MSIYRSNMSILFVKIDISSFFSSVVRDISQIRDVAPYANVVHSKGNLSRDAKITCGALQWTLLHGFVAECRCAVFSNSKTDTGSEQLAGALSKLPGTPYPPTTSAVSLSRFCSFDGTTMCSILLAISASSKACDHDTRVPVGEGARLIVRRNLGSEICCTTTL